MLTQVRSCHIQVNRKGEVPDSKQDKVRKQAGAGKVATILNH